MSEPFLTISKNTSNEMVIKKSRFICSIARVSTENEAQQFIEQVNTENRKATHNCYAYMIGDRDQVQRESDNGEPSGTAGVPILESLKLAKIHNVVAVVTRYFGGIKLGAGGLIRAYSNSATNAIHKAGLVQRIKQAVLEITVNYSQHDSLLHYLDEQGISLAGEQFSATVQTNIYVDEAKLDSFIKELTNRFNGQLTIKKGTSRDHEIPYSTN
ncbi:YigZ family protein [Limosilactobacillus fastidiosus]|uniref:YigZ family protein n=1 Tax=Limosilactobacillus fastidiosus TaxID=2759855 RepID=A0A7W3YBW1_9LACO|nr:YigZ family protein [Limosilactobacillus fastidiosus]MBB1063230.1 YigZ family protein [Limosilactobacillus fastidiosus]MBB1086129.1 YigZ family protein [Limosilactobacillus fastidiosus]MCD7084461.1 YigZ family protein [Limosilactobacillus fastidiosus]MCD7085044.1 YigZ family protein [Limosilactobacillus fastidiosus]MCD7114556.1 YigZ family protein [Limosilactobacillus fastidiosus]